MRGTLKRIVAALLGVVMIATPGRAWAGGLCSTFYQTASHATGGEFIAGILMYQANGSVTRNESSTTPLPVTSAGSSTTTSEPVGFYNMNDGTVWEVNCLSNQGHQI